MDATHETNEQTKLWNGVAGCAWVDMQEALDELYRPIEALLVDAVATSGRRRVLDVGCGTGGTTLAIARRLGSGGGCTGIDISEPMIAVARARAEREGSLARFISGDAGVHPFEPGCVDMIVSRFGVMFFADPVRAFANLRHAASEDAELCAIVWRAAAENPFMTTAERAAAPLLPNLPPRRPDAPGQFAFANDERVRTILEQSGWRQVDIRPIDVACAMPEKELARHVARLGPVGMALREADAPTRARVTETVLAAFEPYVHGNEVRFTAACWMVAARAGLP